MSTPVTVTISAAWVERYVKNDMHFGMKALELLRAAGVPVVGVWMPTGIERGRLTMSQDFFGDVTYTWEP